MVEKISRYLRGYVKIRLESAMPERFLGLCVHNQIPIRNLKNNGLYYEMELSVKDFFRLNSFRRKTGSRILLLEKHGLPFFFQKNKKRKAFFLGFVLCVLLLYWCSLYIWDIRLEGNHFNSDDTILETLRTMNVVDGMRKNELDCQQIAAGIREYFPNVVWVSARIEGTCLVLDMKENEDSYQEENGKTTEAAMDSWDLTAKKDGRVIKMITRKGTPQIQEGEECKKGEILVSGQVAILNNDALVQRYEYVGADADIYLETEYLYYHEFPLDHTAKQYTSPPKTYPYLRIWGREFSFCRTPSENAEIYRQNKTLHLTPSFRLPISYGTVTVHSYEKKEEHYTQKEAEAISQEKIRIFMENLVRKGAYILGKNIEITFDQNRCTAMGTVRVIEACVERTPVSLSPEPEEGESPM